MKKVPLKILLLQSSASDIDLLEGLLNNSPIKPQVVSCDSLSSAIQFLSENDVKMILFGLSSPESEELESVSLIQQVKPNVPIIITGSHIDDSLAVKIMQKGVQDYLVKSQLDTNILTRSINYAVERKNYENKYRDALETIQDHKKREVEQLKEFSKHLLVQSKKLNRKTEEMEEFVYTISHDLKTPLISISGYVDLINEVNEDLSDDLKFYLRRIISNVHLMEKIIKNILEYSRIGRITEEKIEINTVNLLEAIKKRFLPRLNEKEIVLQIDDNLPHLLAEKTRMNQLFENLISNGIKYMGEKKNRRIHIGLNGEPRNRIATFFVADTGIGIAEEYHSKLFRLFSRLHNDLDESGTGIGLANVKKIVETHGGKIWLESKLDEGTTFYIDLPVSI